MREGMILPYHEGAQHSDARTTKTPHNSNYRRQISWNITENDKREGGKCGRTPEKQLGTLERNGSHGRAEGMMAVIAGPYHPRIAGQSRGGQVLH